MTTKPSLSRPFKGLYTLTVPFRRIQNETKAIVKHLQRPSVGYVEGPQQQSTIRQCDRNRRRSLLPFKQSPCHHVVSEAKTTKEPSTTDRHGTTETMTTNKNRNSIVNNTLASEQEQEEKQQYKYLSKSTEHPFNSNRLISWLTRLGSILWSCLPTTILYRFYQRILHYLANIYQAGSSTIPFPKAPFAKLRKWAKKDVSQFQQGRGQWKYAFAAGMTKFVYDFNETAGKKKRQTLFKHY
jgi:hypothetical protein